MKMFLCGLENASIAKCVSGRVLWCVLYIDFWYDCCFPFTAPFVSFFLILYIYIYMYIYNLYTYIFIFIFKYICIRIHSFTVYFLFFLQSFSTLRSGLPVLLYTYFRALPLFCTSSFVSMYVLTHVYTLHTTDCALPCMYDCMNVCIIFPYDRALPILHIFTYIWMCTYLTHTTAPYLLLCYLYICIFRAHVFRNACNFFSPPQIVWYLQTQSNRHAFQNRVSS